MIPVCSRLHICVVFVCRMDNYVNYSAELWHNSAVLKPDTVDLGSFSRPPAVDQEPNRYIPTSCPSSYR